MRLRPDGLMELPDGTVVRPDELVTFGDLFKILGSTGLRTVSGRQMFASPGGGGGGIGPRGIQGVPGTFGNTGIQGVTGPSGTGSGLQGATGIQGATGPQGTPEIAGLPMGYVFGAHLTWESVNTVSLGSAGLPSGARDADDTYNIEWTGVIGPIDIRTNGPNGLDAGVEAPDTWYAVFAIANSLGTLPVAGLLSTSQASPVLPPGYDTFRRLGWVRNGAASDFLNFFQRGAGLDRSYNFNVDRSLLIALSAGVAQIYTAVPLDPWMPPSSHFVFLNIGFDTQNASDILNFRPTGSTVTSPVFFVEEVATPGSRRITTIVEMVLPTQSVDYEIISGGGGTPQVDIYVEGFRDSLLA